MAIDWQDFQDQQAASFDRVTSRFGADRIGFGTAGELAALMARLPPGTPVIIDEAVRIDCQLDLDTTSNRTIAVAEVVPVGDPRTTVEVDDGGQVRPEVVVTPMVQLGAVIVAADASAAPELTEPFQPYDRAVEAAADERFTVVFDAHVELLNWMAATLDTPAMTDDEEEDEEEDEEDLRRARRWVDDPELRATLAVEAERLRQAAARLSNLRARVADYEAVIGVTEAAEDIVRGAADHHDDDRPESPR